MAGYSFNSFTGKDALRVNAPVGISKAFSDTYNTLMGLENERYKREKDDEAFVSSIMNIDPGLVVNQAVQRLVVKELQNVKEQAASILRDASRRGTGLSINDKMALSSLRTMAETKISQYTNDGKRFMSDYAAYSRNPSAYDSESYMKALSKYYKTHIYPPDALRPKPLDLQLYLQKNPLNTGTPSINKVGAQGNEELYQVASASTDEAKKYIGTVIATNPRIAEWVSRRYNSLPQKIKEKYDKEADIDGLAPDVLWAMNDKSFLDAAAGKKGFMRSKYHPPLSYYRPQSYYYIGGKKYSYGVKEGNVFRFADAPPLEWNNQLVKPLEYDANTGKLSLLTKANGRSVVIPINLNEISPSSLGILKRMMVLTSDVNGNDIAVSVGDYINSKPSNKTKKNAGIPYREGWFVKPENKKETTPKESSGSWFLKNK